METTGDSIAILWQTIIEYCNRISNISQHFKVVNITNWVRGEETLHLIEPRFHKLGLLGLGRSIGTGPSGITAEVFVVSTFDELAANASLAEGKIVVFNAPFVSYDVIVYNANCSQVWRNSTI
jgi:carboxypeptidase Q